MSIESRTESRLLAGARQRGVTLIELILFIMIVGVALGGILTVMNLTTRGSADPMRAKQALIIAEGVLEEVQQAKFSYCDPADPNAGDQAVIKDSAANCAIPENWGQKAPEPTGANNGRPFDNVNDYVNASGAATAAFNNTGGVLADATGRALDVAGYTVRLTIQPAQLNGIGDAGSAADTEVLRITVQVDFDGQTLALDGYRTRYAPYSL